MAQTPFVWGSGGRRLTPEEIAVERRTAALLGQEAMSTAPVGHWSAGLNRVAQGLMSGYDSFAADQASKQNGAESSAAMAKMASLLGGGGVPAPAAAPIAAPPVVGPAVAPQGPPGAPMATPPMGAAPIPAAAGLNEAIQTAATARGVDPAYMTRLAMVESSGNPNASTPLSSAKGAFQFIDSTAKQYGLANPNDPVASADAAARLTLDNKAALTKVLGREPTMGELYLAHQQGAAGAAKLLANPDAPVEAVIGQKAAANNGAKPGMTAGQFASKWTGKFSDVGAAPAATSTAPAQPAMPAINPAIIQALSSPYVDANTKNMASMLLKSHLEQQQSQNKVTTIDLGNAVGVMDARGNLVRQLPKGEPNKGPEFGVIGKDEYGNERYGWRDPRTQTEKPAQSMSMPVAQPSAIPPVPPGVDPKVWRESQSKRATEEAMPASSDTTSKLRNEIQGLPSYKNIAQAAPVYKSMYEAAGRDTRAADVNMIYGMAKIMDPGSVVRESEMTVASAIATLPEQLKATVSSQLQGSGRLTPEVRAAIMQEARSRMLSYQGMFDQDAGMYRGIATRGRMNTEDVIPSFGTFDEYKPPAPAASAGQPIVIDGYKIKAR